MLAVCPDTVRSEKARRATMTLVSPHGMARSGQRDLVEEEAVAFRYNGFSHAVMMATPEFYSDFALGFSLTEGVIDGADGIARLEIRQSDDGVLLDISLSADCLRRYLQTRRVRLLRGHTSCGICGKEDLSDVRKPAKRVRPSRPPGVDTVERALSALRDWQPLSRVTRGAHAAAWIDLEGKVSTVREDVGRHNALDKLIGAGLGGAFSPSEGFCLITSRCSFEMVQKAVMAGFSTLMAISAPTALSIRTARETGLTVISLSKEGGYDLYTPPSLSTDAAA